MARRERGTGSVPYQHGKYWRASVSLGVTPDGRRLRKEFQARTRQAAARKRDEALERLRGGLPLGGRITVGAYAASWLSDVEPTVGAATFAFYRAIVDNHFEEIEPVPLPALSPEHVRALIAARIAEGYASRTVRGVVQTLALILRRASVDGHVARNVAALVKLPRLEQAEPRTFTMAQAGRFLKALAGDPLEALYAVALGTGLRRGELLARTWDDVDLTAETISVRSGKSPTARRLVALPSFAVERLRAMPRGIGPIWTASPSMVSRHFTVICRRAGLPALTLHELRHTANTLMAETGTAREVRQRTMGHNRPEMTDHYTHGLWELQREAARRLGEALG